MLHGNFLSDDSYDGNNYGKTTTTKTTRKKTTTKKTTTMKTITTKTFFLKGLFGFFSFFAIICTLLGVEKSPVFRMCVSIISYRKAMKVFN